MERADQAETKIIGENFDEPNSSAEIVFDMEKDFYKGIRGELRFKAEGLFKKAREKGISIEDIEIDTVRQVDIEVPGLGNIQMPAYVVKVRGMLLENQQIMVDGKQIDFYNLYQKYLSERIQEKNQEKDEKGKVLHNNKKPVIKQNPDLDLSDWEKFEIGKAIIEDKEFGLEKTITGACDRVIRKLMGENDWLYPGEARLLEEEFNEIDKKVSKREAKRGDGAPVRKATEKQLSYFKSKLKNAGLNPEDKSTINIFTGELGLIGKPLEEYSVNEMSKMIDSVTHIVDVVKEKM